MTFQFTFLFLTSSVQIKILQVMCAVLSSEWRQRTPKCSAVLERTRKFLSGYLYELDTKYYEKNWNLKSFIFLTCLFSRHVNVSLPASLAEPVTVILTVISRIQWTRKEDNIIAILLVYLMLLHSKQFLLDSNQSLNNEMCLFILHN